MIQLSNRASEKSHVYSNIEHFKNNTYIYEKDNKLIMITNFDVLGDKGSNQQRPVNNHHQKSQVFAHNR